MKKLVLLFVAVFCVSATVAWSDELSSAQQAKLIQAIDSYAARMADVALKIWSAPELGYQETKTSALLQDELKKAGFKVDAGVAGMPTAFVARAGTNDGPVIAILAEIDALPGMSQTATPDRHPIANQNAGHACGHHLFGTGSVAAAIAIKNWLAETGTKGQIRLYGTPAEEGGGGKSTWCVPVYSKMSTSRFTGIRATPIPRLRIAIWRIPAPSFASAASPPTPQWRPSAAARLSTASRR